MRNDRKRRCAHHSRVDCMTTVLEAIRRRRMHRHFDTAPLAEETLRILAWAATRAPVGGNEPSRFLLVIKDLRLVKTAVEVSPSYFGTMPPAIIAVLTDT